MADDGTVVALLDGRRVVLRPVVPADRQAVGTFFDACAATSPEAMRVAAVHAGSSRLRAELVTRDRDHGALVAVPAETGGPPVAFTRWHYLPDEQSCEIILLVAQGWQHRRLGAALLEAAVEDARAEGYRQFHARMQGANPRMLGLLRELVSPVRTRIDGGFTRVDFAAPQSPAPR
jgi:GNAT superfamily N-acetyltransferase